VRSDYTEALSNRGLTLHELKRFDRAGLELVPAVGVLKTHAPLQTRVGVATGLVVVGDIVDAGGAQERGIIGETPNLAARLQSIAQPNMVVIAEGTRRLLVNLFELEDLGAKDLKGIARPVPSLRGAEGERGGEPLRGDARERAHRPRRT
jgi:class 3 adenylate cyclase